MGEDLGRFLADEPIRARQVSATHWRWARRNPVIAVLGGVLMALLIATTVGSVVAASYFRSLAGSESRANQKSQEAERRATLERDHSRQQSADLTLEKGFALGQEGHADRGLLWMLEALKTAPDDAENFGERSAGTWVRGSGRSISRSGSSIPAVCTIGSPSALTEDHLQRVTFPIIVRTRHQSTSGIPPRAESSQLFPGVFGSFVFRPDGKVLFGIADNGGDGRRRPDHGAGALDDRGITRRAVGRVDSLES